MTSANSSLTVVVLAAGKGTRMKSSLPKVLHEVARRPMLHHVLATATELKAREMVVVIGPGMDEVRASAIAAAPQARVVVQEQQLGTGDAVRAALPALQAARSDLLVLFGDTPLVRAETIGRMMDARAQGAQIVLLGFRPPDAAQYGRLVTRASDVERIVEFSDASPEERAIGYCNAGIFLIDGRVAAELVGALKPNNAKGEYYLTDIVAMGRVQGIRTVAVEADPGEVAGVNSRADLAAIEQIFQARARAAAMAGGVTLEDPASVYFAADTVLGRDIVIAPHVVFGPGVRVADNVRIEAFSHIEGASIAAGARVGPFARLRPGAQIGENAHIGNFVEIKNAKIEVGAKVNHLSYIGDARVGAAANIGAGTITCNYDGFDKFHTDIGAGAFVGSDTALIAPVSVGDGAYIGSGSVIAKDVPPDALVLTRADLVEKPGWAARFRARKQAERAERKKKG